MALSQEVLFQHEAGLHARPAAAFVQVASGFASRITIANASRASKTVNAKSIIGVMSAGVKKNDSIIITAEGEDEQAALNALVDLVKSNFGE